ncbi:MAG: purine-nucleoside phosphorylase [Turicibacter sp.]|nr:purine-nucleoside phosphorylase [Turicibacter sp.]
MTPHIEANTNDFAKTVLMPGDPLRAKFIAETFLTDAKEVNTVRGMLGYTGKYKEKPISVMGSGMGMPSIGIYSYELYTVYDVDNIIRVGTAGGIRKDLNVGDIVVGMGACTNSNFAYNYKLPGIFAPTADYGLLTKIQKAADALKYNLIVGNILSSDVFYVDDGKDFEKWLKMGVLAVEMEAASLYMNAARLGKAAIAICSISDTIFTEQSVSAELRRTSFTKMMEIALETVLF